MKMEENWANEWGYLKSAYVDPRLKMCDSELRDKALTLPGAYEADTVPRAHCVMFMMITPLFAASSKTSIRSFRESGPFPGNCF